MGIFILALLIISVVVVCTVFLVLAISIGKHFNQIGNQTMPTNRQRRRPGSSR